MEFVDFVREKKINYGQLEKLKEMSLLCNTLAEDAEMKQFLDPDPDVDMWLTELQEVLIGIENLVDTIDTEALLCKMVRDYPGEFLRLDSPTDFDVTKIEKDMLEFLKRLESLLKLKDDLNLKERVDFRTSQFVPVLIEKSVEELNFTESGDEYDDVVYGRDDEKQALLKLLLSDYDNIKLPVICIWGMGGIGKTSVAKWIFDRVKVSSRFNLKAWISVHDQCDIFGLAKSIIESVTGKACDIMDLNFLQIELEVLLTGKKFLFVQDGVWDKNYVLWDFFRSIFECGAKGSKIIVTTRSEAVASLVGNVPYFGLNSLAPEDSYQLFAQHAFDGVESDACLNFQGIGRKIVERCNGLPLAIILIGGLLRFESERESWENILNSDLWEPSNQESSILSALQLSYLYLPSHLKLCFAYCSVFPRGCEVNKNLLILMWMAQDLLQPQLGKSAEEVGETYLNHLKLRSLLQQSSRIGQSTVKMHGIVRDFAISMSTDFYCNVYGHASLVLVGETWGENFASKAKTLLAFSEEPWRTLNRGLPMTKLLQLELFPRLQCLRVLSLRYCPILEFPDSICSMEHLKYLDLSFTLLEEIPSKLCSLFNLQTLLLSNCKNLIRLPTSIESLENLRHLDISKTPLAEMPLHMGRMNSLRTLSDFVLGRRGGSGIEELKELQHLRGTLCISGLQNVGDVGNVSKANLKDKIFLNELVLKWGGDAEDSQKEREILNRLQPHANLEKLNVELYGSTKFPDWVGDSLFCNMVSVSLRDCKNCYSLPPLGQLPSLRELDIIGLDSVRIIGQEFYSNGPLLIKPFRSLETLRFRCMSDWQEWFCLWDEEDGGFPCLKELYLEDCPQFYGNLPCFLPSLRSLYILRCQQIVALLSPADVQMHTTYPSLQTMEINDCMKLETLLEGEWPSNLKSLTISNCRNLTSLTIKRLQEDLRSLEKLHIV